MSSSDIQYSDGAIEGEILEWVKAADDLRSGAAIARERYADWATRYHLCPERSNLLRHLNFSGLDVLEVGAGMGAISRFLAEEARSLVALEGTKLRLETLRARLRDLHNWEGMSGNLSDARFEKKFDAVLSIGVLEYSELFLAPPAAGGTAFDSFLKLATAPLKDDGVLIIAIENKLGIKYWSGAAEDHSSAMFDGICGYPRTASAKTFSQHELIHLLESHGFDQIDRYYPFPDYKIPSSVLSAKFIEAAPEIAANLAAHQAFDNYGMPRVTLFPEILALKNVADSGLFEQFANSFLFVASRSRESATRKSLLKNRLRKKEVAWHYSLGRKIPCTTVFTFRDAELRAEKRALEKTFSTVCQSREGIEFHWDPLPALPATRKANLRYLLAREAYFGNREGFIEYLTKYFNWAFATWPSEQWSLAGDALDATVPNVACDPDGSGFEVFDLEWRFKGEISKTWFVFRNLFGLHRDFSLLAGTQFFKLREVYGYFCGRLGLLPDFERDLLLESLFQETVIAGRSAEIVEKELQELFNTPFEPTLPRSPVSENANRARLKTLEAESARWESPRHRLFQRANDELKKIAPLHRLIKGAVEFALPAAKRTT